MMTTTTHRFSLEIGSKKHICPSCRQKTFVWYIDNASGGYLPDEVGRCDRENHCGHHYTPGQYFKEHGLQIPVTEKKEREPEPQKPIDYISLDLVQKSMHGYEQSAFAGYIIRLFGENAGKSLLLKYFSSRAKADGGKANIFWRIDCEGKVRTGKIMIYHPGTGKRNKAINPTWAHNALKPFNHKLCFFGEHLITEYPDRTIAICESEKTAIIASFFFPQYVWLATGGASGCKWREYSVFKVLKNRNVILFPDFGYYNKKSGKTCFQEWSDRANAIMERMKCNIRVSSVLEKNIPEEERANDYDLADMLIKRDEQTGISLTDFNYPAIWDYVNQEYYEL
jgi:hypothetical protein